MNLEELLSQTKIEKEKLSFETMDKILKFVSKAIELNTYSISEWCSNCTEWKIKTKCDYYPWYTTEDCKCTIDNELINLSLKHLYWINKKELQKYNYRLYFWNKPWLKYLYDLIENPKNWYYFYWPPWNWKTYSAYILLYMYSITNTVFATSIQNVLEDSRPSEINKQQWLLYKKCVNVDVLLLDDVNREKTSEWVMNKMFELLNIRDKRWLVTIFTSNYPFEELSIFADKAIKSRFTWNSVKINLLGNDLRSNN